jgi:hypothetical protein
MSAAHKKMRQKYVSRSEATSCHNGMDGREDEKDIGNVATECEKEDGNCEKSEAEMDDRNDEESENVKAE